MAEAQSLEHLNAARVKHGRSPPFLPVRSRLPLERLKRRPRMKRHAVHDQPVDVLRLSCLEQIKLAA
jgi:hypothetical protein